MASRAPSGGTDRANYVFHPKRVRCWTPSWLALAIRRRLWRRKSNAIVGNIPGETTSNLHYAQQVLVINGGGGSTALDEQKCRQPSMHRHIVE